MGGTIYNNHTLEPIKELGLDSQRDNDFASELHVHSVNYAAKLVHTKRALSSTAINSDQETISSQACDNLLIPVGFFFFWWRRFTVPGTKVLLSLTNVGSVFTPPA